MPVPPRIQSLAEVFHFVRVLIGKVYLFMRVLGEVVEFWCPVRVVFFTVVEWWREVVLVVDDELPVAADDVA